jgi:transcriptional regulator with XRE-family HTH domain
MKVSNTRIREEKLQKSLQALRKSADLTQLDLANLISKPQSFVSKYESGERQLKYQELELICFICGSSLEEFARKFAEKYPMLSKVS